jgi:hypothetical protein
MLDSIVGFPAFVRDGRLDVIGVNAMGRNLESLAFEQPGPPVNLAGAELRGAAPVRARGPGRPILEVVEPLAVDVRLAPVLGRLSAMPGGLFAQLVAVAGAGRICLPL